MKFVVTGDREWTSLETIAEAFEYVLARYGVKPEDVRVVEGEARGADKGCKVVAEAMGMKVIPEEAEWTKYGKAAGVLRNQRMLDTHPDVVVCVAFHDDLEHSKGTKDMVKRCKKIALPVLHFQTNSKVPTFL